MASNSPTPILTLLALGVVHISVAGPAAAQNCDCKPYECCKWGYCGTSSDYCSHGCRSGPCSAESVGMVLSSGVSMESIVTEDFLNGIKSKAGNGCAGKIFYTRHSFLDAARSYPDFGKGRSNDDSKREIAAFFAHATYETGHLCYIEEINPSTDFCAPGIKQWPCYPGKRYYGRGPMQLSWNFNYGPAGKSIGLDLLRNPERVAQDPVVSFKTALWFWMNNVHQAMPQGFGATIRAIYGSLTCNGNNPGAMNVLVDYYKDYCQQFGVDPGNNITC